MKLIHIMEQAAQGGSTKRTADMEYGFDVLNKGMA